MYPKTLWNPKRIELLTELIYAMSQNLGYDLDKTLIETQAYSPNKVGSTEQEQERIRLGVIAVLDGTSPLPIKIKLDSEPTTAAAISPQQPAPQPTQPPATP
jgi:hypothetical protein